MPSGDARLDVRALTSGVTAGQARAVARAISLIENNHPDLDDLLAQFASARGRAHVVGITGPPGAGKSTITNSLVRAWRARGQVGGVLAVDPSSPFSGGALLGDRIRMEEHATDRGVFLRSMASRGHLGGAAAATGQAVTVLEAAGCDLVLIETVGVGQSEIEVAGLADTTVIVLAPGLGDGIQAAKAGVLEIGDLFVVNKADRDGAGATRRDLRHMIAMSERTARGAWQPPILSTTALDGTGINAVVDAVDEHRQWLEQTGGLQRRRADRVRGEVEALAVAGFREALRAHAATVDALVADILAGRTDPARVARQLRHEVAATGAGDPRP